MQELQNQPVLVLLFGMKEISWTLPSQKPTEIYMIKQELIRLWVPWIETVGLIDTCRIKYKINEIIKALWESMPIEKEPPVAWIRKETLELTD